MDKRFANIFGLDEAQSIALLDTPLDQLAADDSRYVAAAQLANYPSAASIEALVRAVHNTDESLDNKITRRKSVESLGKLKAAVALPDIQACLTDADPYTVEVAAWAIGEIGTTDKQILAAVAQQLARPNQTYRVMIHTLAKLGYVEACDRIRPFTQSDDELVASAAITAVCRFTQDDRDMHKVVAYLQHESVNARRACLQDLMDARYYPAMAAIAGCPISVAFRLRAVKQLAEAGLAEGQLSEAAVLPLVDQVLRDHPQDINFVHEYDQLPSLEFLIQELYQTDFGRAYLAIDTLLEHHREAAPAALLTAYAGEAQNDYGAHYHVMKLLGWLKYAPAYDLLREGLENTSPQYLKSRAAGAIALGELGDDRAIPALKESLKTPIWTLQYGAVLALEQLGETDFTLPETAHALVRARAAAVQPTLSVG
ncbi:MAG: HEAT repeat domain-containing protein [Cyanobacteria bacterium P01_A01_bin.105]